MGTTVGMNNLPVPVNGDTPGVVRDITALANAVDPLLGGPYICTSTTRPVNPPFGRFIMETDTGYGRIWMGSSVGWKMILCDTGNLTDGSVLTMGTSWSLIAYHARRVDAMVSLYVDVQYSDATGFTVGTTGNITNITIATLSDTRLYPFGASATLSTNSTGPMVACSIGGNGAISLTSLGPNYPTPVKSLTVAIQGAWIGVDL